VREGRGGGERGEGRCMGGRREEGEGRGSTVADPDYAFQKIVYTLKSP
jgi:hypothetical protein